MMRERLLPALLLALSGIAARGDDMPTLKARTHDSGFSLSHDTYNGLSVPRQNLWVNSGELLTTKSW